jgi:hypothetical protein
MQRTTPGPHYRFRWQSDAEPRPGQGDHAGPQWSAAASVAECTAEHTGQAHQAGSVMATTGTGSIRRRRLPSGKPRALVTLVT